jgi:hypothetical protein
MWRTADQGGLVKKDSVERLVNEEHDRGAHFEQALRTDFGCLRKDIAKLTRLAPDLRCVSGGEEAETALQYRLPGDVAGRVRVARLVAMFFLAARFSTHGRSVCPRLTVSRKVAEPREQHKLVVGVRAGFLVSDRKAQQTTARDPQSEVLLRAVMDPIGVSTTPKSLASTTAQSLQSGCSCHRPSLLERWQAKYFARRKLHQPPASSWAKRTFEALIADSETRLQITLSWVSIT